MADIDRSCKPYMQPQWLISGRDFRTHAFHHVFEQGQRYLEALCTHSIPTDEVVPPAETVLTPDTCGRCLRLHGEALAEHFNQQWHD